ncbi:hypothetical protein NDN08_002218 [Rhodosorus marinus]|uniref:Mg-protoporphyrin IX chelatase n=1 Tax=Rhodosorus marinus TaxID=101924 RepID=A0AAV8UVX7_9RHOD|nr:hypothetical protein NDN08_002218 [Rhodosorus marinus]
MEAFVGVLGSGQLSRSRLSFSGRRVRVLRCRSVTKAQAAEAPETEGLSEGVSEDVSEVDFAQQDVATVFPLSAVVGQDAVKTALLLAAVNPELGGVCISGRRGTAKSVMARAIHALLPPIEVVKGSFYNGEPSEGDDSAETIVVRPPFVQIPLNTTEDRLIGTVNVEKSVTTGKTEFQPGLLAAAHRGVLYIDEINLLDQGIVNLLLSVISEGVVRVEREGMSYTHPCRPLIIATFNPEEGDVRAHFLDRIAVVLSADSNPLSLEERIDAVESSIKYRENPKDFVSDVFSETDQMATNIILAREYLKDVELDKSQVEYLVSEAVRADTQGHRCDLYACQVARAAAALEGRDYVTKEDLKTAVQLVILPRSRAFNNQDMMEQEAPPPPPPPPPQDQMEDDETEQEPDEEDEKEEDQEQTPEIPEEFIFDPEGVILDPEVLNFAQGQRGGKSGTRGVIFSTDRGRYVKAMLPKKGEITKLAVDATLRASAPYQKARRERHADTEDAEKGVYVEEADLRIKRLARKAGSLILFLVDASGSMALNRMNSAKGAAIKLLTEAYQTRDKISLITFQGDRAEVILPPTKSITMAKKRLETMPCGGGSPMAHALTMATRVGLNAQKTGDVGKVIMVVISDGRANVPLHTSEGEEVEEKLTKAEMKEEVLNLSKSIGALGGFNLLCIDTENKFVSTGLARELAEYAQGSYHYLPKATDQSVAEVAGGAISAMRST